MLEGGGKEKVGLCANLTFSPVILCGRSSIALGSASTCLFSGPSIAQLADAFRVVFAPLPVFPGEAGERKRGTGTGGAERGGYRNDDVRRVPNQEDHICPQGAQSTYNVCV